MMPNHIMNRISGPKELIDLLMNEEDGKPCVDFNRIIPRPEIVPAVDVPSHIELAALVALGIELQHPYPDRDRFLPKNFSVDDFATFISFLRSYHVTGAMHGLEWNRANWGTKWNAYQTERKSDRVVEFQTAWSAPHPVIEKLAEQAGMAFGHEWADEDFGSNVGRTEVASGRVDRNDLDGTLAGWELCFDLWPDRKDDYRRVGDTYEYAEETEA